MLFHTRLAGDENTQNKVPECSRSFCFPRLYTVQEAEENQSTFIKHCRGGGFWARVVCPIRGPELMCAWAQSPPHPRSRQEKKTSFEGVHRRSHIKEKRGGFKRGASHLIWLKGSLWRPWDQWASRALTRRTRERDLLLTEKVLKSALKACSWCEMPHSPFYWPLLRTCENPNDAKQRNWDPLAKRRQSHAWKCVRRANSRPLIGRSNFSSVSQGRFLLKKGRSSAMAAGFEELRRCH